MQRVLVIGSPGSGKSVFSRKLAASTGLSVHHLDMLYWNADQTTIPQEEFLSRLDAVLRQDAWIIDGNYASTLERRLERCNTIFLLDYPVETCIEGVQRRMNTPRPDIPWIETEFDPEFMDFIRSFPEVTLPGMMELLKRYPEKKLIIFHSRKEANAYLNTQREAASQK